MPKSSQDCKLPLADCHIPKPNNNIFYLPAAVLADPLQILTMQSSVRVAKVLDEAAHWLVVAPCRGGAELIQVLAVRQPYPMSWGEQSVLFGELPAYLQKKALFKVNTGCREQEVCKLRWDWEIAVPELETSVFLIPADFGGRHARSGVKNGDERLVVLNSVARSIIEKQRGVNKDWGFPYNDTAMHRMNDTA